MCGCFPVLQPPSLAKPSTNKTSPPNQHSHFLRETKKLCTFAPVFEPKHNKDLQMKKIFFLFLLPLLFSSLDSHAQNFTLTLYSHHLQADSLFLQGFNGKDAFVNLISTPYSEKAVFKQKEKLTPGYYCVCADSLLLFNLLISENKKQNLTVQISDSMTVYFENSPENNHSIAYNKQSQWYAQQAAEINHTFAEAQKTMPEYMLQNLAERLIVQADTLTKQEAAYKKRVIKENPGTLLASLVQFSQEIPPAPQNYYNSRELITQYYAEHAFDNYPFDDERMLNTPMLAQRFREYCANLYYMQPERSSVIADQMLTRAQVNATTYHNFFDRMEKVLGTLTSPYWTEEIYIAMLRNALSYEKLEEKRRNYYQQLLNLHTKNLAGTIATNFNILWSDGTKSTLHDIESEYILLYFQNPDCPTCTEVRGKLAENAEVNQAIASGKLKLVTIYFEQDEDLWRRYLANKANPSYLHGWNQDHQIEEQNLYDLRIIPYMFLLDKDKRIIKKDILYNEISNYLKYLHIVE